MNIDLAFPKLLNGTWVFVLRNKVNNKLLAAWVLSKRSNEWERLGKNTIGQIK